MYALVVLIIKLLEDNIEQLDTLGATSDADMALMYLRHLERTLRPELPTQTN